MQPAEGSHAQVELAQSEYQLPRLTRMWTHLERQAGGRVRGMGEKQIEVDKRILRSRMAQLRRTLEDVRMHRKQYRVRRAEVCCCTRLLNSRHAGLMLTVFGKMFAGIAVCDARTSTLMTQPPMQPCASVPGVGSYIMSAVDLVCWLCSLASA